MSLDCKINNTCVLERLKFKHQLFAVAVSVNGDVILQFENYVMVYIQRQVSLIAIVPRLLVLD